MSDNYQKLHIMWHDKFRDMPCKEEKAAALGIPVSNGKAYISYYGREYNLDFATGDILPLNPEKAVTFYDSMFIYHLFWFSADHPYASFEYVPFRDVPGAAVFDAAFKKLSIDPMTQRFNGRIDAFCKACESLNAEKIPYGDAGYSIPVWNNLKLHIILWDGDDEFPASVTVLFDKNITQFTHVETVVTIGGDGIQAVMDADESMQQLFANPTI